MRRNFFRGTRAFLVSPASVLMGLRSLASLWIKARSAFIVLRLNSVWTTGRDEACVCRVCPGRCQQVTTIFGDVRIGA